MLPDKQRKGAGWEPPLPLILAALHITSAEEKQERLALHIQWAQDHGALEKVASFLESLPESEWEHGWVDTDLERWKSRQSR
jgi:hypothetical protein